MWSKQTEKKKKKKILCSRARWQRRAVATRPGSGGFCAEPSLSGRLCSGDRESYQWVNCAVSTSLPLTHILTHHPFDRCARWSWGRWAWWRSIANNHRFGFQLTVDWSCETDVELNIWKAWWSQYTLHNQHKEFNTYTFKYTVAMPVALLCVIYSLTVA